MGESQSRYSIVERLTQKKLDIISENLELDDDVKGKEQRVGQLKKDLSDWEDDIQQDLEKTRRLKQRELERCKKLDDLKPQRDIFEEIFKKKMSDLIEVEKRVTVLKRKYLSRYSYDSSNPKLKRCNHLFVLLVVLFLLLSLDVDLLQIIAKRTQYIFPD